MSKCDFNKVCIATFSLSELLNEEQFQLWNVSVWGWQFNVFTSEEKKAKLSIKPEIWWEYNNPIKTWYPIKYNKCMEILS